MLPILNLCSVQCARTVFPAPACTAYVTALMNKENQQEAHVGENDSARGRERRALGAHSQDGLCICESGTLRHKGNDKVNPLNTFDFVVCMRLVLFCSLNLVARVFSVVIPVIFSKRFARKEPVEKSVRNNNNNDEKNKPLKHKPSSSYVKLVQNERKLASGSFTFISKQKRVTANSFITQSSKFDYTNYRLIRSG